jgi:hypothetical protein
VFSNPEVISERDFVADGNGGGGGSVTVNISPAGPPFYKYKYKYIDNSLVAYSQDAAIGTKSLTLDENSKVYIDIDSYFGGGKKITLGAEFYKAEGPLMMEKERSFDPEPKYYEHYDSLAEALNANSGTIGLTVVGSFTEPGPGAVGIPAGTAGTITTLASDSTSKTIRLGTNADGKIIVNSGGSLTLNASGGLIIDGAVYVASGGSLAIAGTLSVKEISLEPDAGTIGVFRTLSLPAGYPQQINITAAWVTGDGFPVLKGIEGTPGYGLSGDDCKRFIVKGANNSYYRVNPQGYTGVTAMVVARRNDGMLYASIQDAVDDSSGNSTNPDTITLLANIDISTAAGTISIGSIGSNKHIKLVPGDATRTVKRGADYTGPLFYVESGASLTLEGNGGNQLIIDGDGINNKTATAALVTVSGGTLTMNAGAVLQNNNNSSSNTGGGVYMNGGMFTMNAGAILQNNNNNKGGGVYVGGGSFTMNGGAINGNTAGSGGGVYVSGNFTMSGGAINGNTAGSGGGVYVGGDFTMSGGAIVAQDNDVYLSATKVIKVGWLTGSGFAAKITPVNPATYLKILSGVNASTIKRFTLSPGVEKWSIELKDDGYGELSYCKVYLSSNKQGYDTLKDAVNAAATTDTIFLLDTTITLSDTISIPGGKHITLVPDGATRTVKRGASGGSLFTVPNGASLTLEGNNGYELIIDGNKSVVTTATAALVRVTGGTLTLNHNAVIQNNNSSSSYGGGVYVNYGSFNMNGGTISGNSAYSYGGGVYVGSGGRFNMYGGTISSNSATSGGGVYVGSGGRFNMYGGSTISGNSASGDGGGVYVGSGGSFNMDGGTISGNSASGDGGGVYVGSGGGSFTRNGGIIYGGMAGDDKNTASSDGRGHALYNAAGSGTATDNTIQ